MIDYQDPYLAPLINKNPYWESRAMEDVAVLGDFPAPWPDKLTVLRAYVLCCLESLADENDVFAAKLKQYQREYTATLQAARLAAARAGATSPVGLMVKLERA